MENTANLELFEVHKIISEYAERIYEYMEKTQRCTLEDILVNNVQAWNFFRSFFYTRWVGLSQKTISRYCSFMWLPKMEGLWVLGVGGVLHNGRLLGLRHLRGNSRTYTYVEVSGHNLESSQTWGFYLRFLPFYKMLFSKLEFSSLINCFVWISETIRVVWLSVRSFCFVSTYK